MNEAIEVRPLGYKSAESVMIHSRFQPSVRAQMMISFVERWGMVAAQEDGEDSAGRSKLKLSEPGELVARAEALVNGIMDTIERNGWYFEVPSLTDLDKEALEKHNER